ncbi:helix-turn-helix domain-containing protein [Salibacterium sp. K-3]
METSNDKKFRHMFPKELYVLQRAGGAVFQNIIREEENFFRAVYHGRKQKAYEHIENIFHILSVEESEQERLKDYRRFFTFLAGSSAKEFTRHLSFSWEFLAAAVTLMKIIETWETEEEYSEGIYFITNTFIQTINGYQDEYPSHPQIMRFVQFVDDYIYDHLNTQIVAAHLDISSGHLARLVRRHLGTTCIEYIREKKLEESVYLLHDITKPIQEVAAMLHMSPAHFNRVFKEKYQCSPNHYRKRLTLNPVKKATGDQ